MRNNLNLIFFSLVVLFTACSESEMDKEFEMQKLQEKSTRATVSLYPTKDELITNFIGIMNLIWGWTKESALMGETREMGIVFYIDRHLINGQWSGLKAGELQRGPVLRNADDRGSITLEFNGDNYCGCFHTHTSMCMLPDINVERSFGPSSTDYNSAETMGIPQFVYDYVHTVDHELPLDAPSSIYFYGPETRIK